MKDPLVISLMIDRVLYLLRVCQTSVASLSSLDEFARCLIFLLFLHIPGGARNVYKKQKDKNEVSAEGVTMRWR